MQAKSYSYVVDQLEAGAWQGIVHVYVSGHREVGAERKKPMLLATFGSDLIASIFSSLFDVIVFRINNVTLSSVEDYLALYRIIGLSIKVLALSSGGCRVVHEKSARLQNHFR